MRGRIRRLVASRAVSYHGLRHVVLGLGNPGTRYAATRHNVGFMVLDRLAERARLRFTAGRGDFAAARWSAPGGPVLLAKPDTFMNLSGRAGEQLARLSGLAPDEFLVVVDDIDLPLGRLRLRARGGAGGHRGLDSLIAHWGGGDFPRLRLGVGPAVGDAADYVMTPFAPEDLDTVQKMVEAAADAVRGFLAEGLDSAMNRTNSQSNL
ncbi:MAG: aminoacyl-tRNA hydrolase [Candidatus Krumholzibacteriota bacterium]|nr:aminoacyl-tRNA hydrolase [Candidatus Krumholzibacteriota bacterium]